MQKNQNATQNTWILSVGAVLHLVNFLLTNLLAYVLPEIKNLQ